MAVRLLTVCAAALAAEQILARRQKAGLKAQVRASMQSLQGGETEDELSSEQKHAGKQTAEWVPNWVPLVRRRRSTTPVPINPDDPLDGHGFCCCKNEPCSLESVGDTGQIEAVFSPNQKMCCKLKQKECHVWTQNWFSGYKDPAPSEDYCNPAKSMDVAFEPAPELVDITTTTMAPGDYEPGSAGHTVHTYCNFSQHVDFGGDDDEAEVQARHKIVSQIVDELSDNSIDSMAKSMFTVYLCVRWAPSSEFVAMVQNEVATGQLAEKEAIQHYEDFTFMPMKCTENMKVYDIARGTLNQTFFEQFEAEMEAEKKWLSNEGDLAFAQRLGGVSQARDKGQQDKVEELSMAFDLNYVRERASSCSDPNNGKILVDPYTSSTEELLSDCAAANWWETKLSDWHRSMPFNTFMSPKSDLDSNARPKPHEQVMLCFGKRVASQLHRRSEGDHLITDQTTVGCHGFYSFDVASTMLDRIVRLWRPPTCQLAAMELDFKVKILEMMADMNDRLFDALPSLLMEEETDQMNFDGEKMAPAGPVGVLNGMWKAIVDRFDFFRSKSQRLGTLLGDTVVKWVVCPLNAIRNQTDLDALDSALGTEDLVSRYYARIANARHTGENELLPGERCESDLPDLPRAQSCSLGTMRENMPEPYADEHFLCPVLPMLPAKQQLDVFKKKEGLCVLHQTMSQLQANHWYFRGHTPSQKQYNATENVPNGDYQAAKFVSERSHPDSRFNIYRTFVKYAVGCTETERLSTPRWCATPEIYNDGMSDRNLLTNVPIPGDNVGDEDGFSNDAWGVRFTQWVTRSVKGVAGWVSQVQTEWFGRASKRYSKMYDQSFLETEANELLHAISFQRHLGDEGGDSTGRESYDRYVVTVPCSSFEPDREFELKYDWAEYGLQFIKKVKSMGVDLNTLPAFAFDVRSDVTLNVEDESNSWLRYWTSVRARGIDDDAAQWEKTDNAMFSDLSGSLNPPIAAKAKAEHFKGFTATFACGTRRAMYDLAVDDFTLEDPNLQSYFETCVRDGAAANAELKADNPETSFTEEQVVVRMTIHDLPSCEQYYADDLLSMNETLNHVVSNFIDEVAGCQSVLKEDIPSYLHGGLEGDSFSDAKFRGVLFGFGTPMNTLKEVLIDPADVIAEAF